MDDMAGMGGLGAKEENAILHFVILSFCGRNQQLRNGAGAGVPSANRVSYSVDFSRKTRLAFERPNGANSLRLAQASDIAQSVSASNAVSPLFCFRSGPDGAQRAGHWTEFNWPKGKLRVVIFSFEPPAPQIAAGGVSALVIAGALILGYLRWGWNLAALIAKQIDKPDLPRMISESQASFARVHGRLWRAMLMGAMWPAIYGAPLLFIGAVLWAAGAVEHLFSSRWRESALLSYNNWAWYGKFGFHLFYFGLCAAVLIALVQQFRLLNRARLGEPLRWRDVSDEFDRSVGVAGVLSAGLFGGVFIGIFVFLLWAVGLGAAAAFQEAGVHEIVGWIFGALLVFSAGWLLLAPILLTFAILALRDPGWLSAAEAGLGMMRFRPRECLGISIRGFLQAPVVYRWPAMLWLILEFAENQMDMLSVILREKRPEDIEKRLTLEAPARSAALQDAYKLLDQGRYLDALNQFQIAYSKNIHSMDALEGVAMAQARIGNVIKAREALERILSTLPSHSRAAQLMGEIMEGHWDEGGALLVQAREKCKQPLGRGVTSLDMIGKTDLPPR